MSDIKTILVVDDDDSIRNVMREALEFHGYRVLTAENGLEAIEKIRLLPTPNLVLLDMAMPVMNGRGFLDAVAQDPVLSLVPVVIISAAVGRESTAGAAACIQKPVDLAVFLKAVEQYSSAN